MDYSGVNMTNVRSSNKSAVLRLLNSSGNMSRKDIAKELQLTPAAVSILCSGLIEDNFIREAGKSEPKGGKAGRKEVFLSLCLDEFFCIAVNMETEDTCVSLVRLDGKLYDTKRLRTDANANIHLGLISKKIREIIEEHGKDKKIIGVGLGIVGSFDEQTGKTSGEFGVWKAGVKAANILSQRSGLPVICQNNVKAFALAQLLYGKQEDNILFIKWGFGIGSALVLGGGVCPGAQEIGHYIIDPYGKMCRCKRQGCLETLASATAISDRIKEIFSPEKTPILYKKLDGDKSKILREVQNINFDTDQLVRDILKRRINKVARAVVNTATVLSPDKVIVFGNMWNKEFFREFQENCKRYSASFDENRIQMSLLQDKADFIGPAALVADGLFFG